ncbi:MAG: hypothetical protein JXI43_07775 [Tissierellales bacterium]|nr:hypothetical protein [Tissierellales bacterium]
MEWIINNKEWLFSGAGITAKDLGVKSTVDSYSFLTRVNRILPCHLQNPMVDPINAWNK